MSVVHWSLYVNSAVISAAAALVLPNVPVYVYRHGGDEFAASLVLSTFSITMTISSWASTSLLEGVRAGLPICLGCLGYGWALLPFFVHDSVASLAFARALQGVCSGFSFPANVAAALQLGRSAVSKNNFWANVGFIVGYLASSHVRDPFGICSVLSALAAVFGLPLLTLKIQSQEDVSAYHRYPVAFGAALALTLASTLPNSAITLLAPKYGGDYGLVIAMMTAVGGIAQLLGPRLGELESTLLAVVLCVVSAALGYSLASVLAAGIATGLMYYAANVYSGGGRGVRAVSTAIGVGYAVNQTIVGAILSAGLDGWRFATLMAAVMTLVSLLGVRR
ncbi:MFS transporter [Methanopyrus kandleri]